MKVLGTYVFTVIGDGREDEFAFTLRALQTPEPIVNGVLPTAILSVKPPGLTATLEKDILRLKFDIPPSSSKVTIDALFGGPMETL